jgi:DNA invertase Pin-like site-specific DNA recombinase
VSKAEQNPDLQLDALKVGDCYRMFVDTASGALDERSELAKVLNQLRPGDTLVVWKLDRLGRSLRHLIDTITALQRRDLGFRSLEENIDTTTPGGKLIFHIFGALTEFERDLIRQRTLAWLAAARARGRAGGRPTCMPPPSWPWPGNSTTRVNIHSPTSPAFQASAVSTGADRCLHAQR